MGARGPQSKPTALKVAEGTYRADRAPANEAKAEGKPTCPSWLSKDEKAEFRRISKQLHAMGLAGKIDSNILARYVVLWMRWRQAEAMVNKLGESIPIRDDAGNVKSFKRSPYAVAANELAGQLHRLESALGMNPSARSRINVEAPASGDGFDEFVSRSNNPFKFPA